ncbi:MAG: hypothetical protein P8X43_10850 [Maritimibacter sp.]
MTQSDTPSTLSRVLQSRAVWPLLALVLIFAVDAIVSPNFFQIRIVGSIAAISGAVIAWRIQAGDPHGLILIWALLAALLCGAWNGALVAVLGIQPIIATLILMVSGRGIGMLINLLYGGTDPSFESALLQGLSTG